MRNHARTHPSYFEPSLANCTFNTSDSSFIRNSTAISGDDAHALSCDMTRITCTDSTFTILDVSEVTVMTPEVHNSGACANDKTLVASSSDEGDDLKTTRRKSAIPVRVQSLTNVTMTKKTSRTSTQEKKFQPTKSTPSLLNRKTRGCTQTTPNKYRTPHKTLSSHNGSTTPQKNSQSKPKKTPMSMKKTPLKQMITPVKRTNTPKTQGTPSRQKKVLRSYNSTPRNRMEVLIHTKKTPISCPKTPNGTQFKCIKCGKSFVNKARLEVHFALHVRETPEKCGIPKKVIKRKLLTGEVSEQFYFIVC